MENFLSVAGSQHVNECLRRRVCAGSRVYIISRHACYFRAWSHTFVLQGSMQVSDSSSDALERWVRMLEVVEWGIEVCVCLSRLLHYSLCRAKFTRNQTMRHTFFHLLTQIHTQRQRNTITNTLTNTLTNTRAHWRPIPIMYTHAERQTHEQTGRNADILPHTHK